MARERRSTHKNNIVIVCEGSDTEPAYLSNLKSEIIGRFDDVRIVPFGSEAKDARIRDAALKTAPKNNSRKPRSSKVPVTRGSGKFYWVKEEIDADAYEQYKEQPTRYVREAQLFLEDGYVEAWAVYDHDKFPDHEGARRLADSDPRLNIAFSSVSFEEWLLLHFERNPKQFARSVCKEDKKDIGCGLTGCSHPNNCQGNVCVAGYLREKNYIPRFAKSDTNLFSNYTKSRLNLVRINAAWVRTLNPAARIYEQNPYTDFDLLLARLLDLKDTFIWLGNAASADIDRCRIEVSRTADGIVLKNVGDRTFLHDVCALDASASPMRPPQKITLTHNEEKLIEGDGAEFLSIDSGLKKHILTF